MSTIDEKLEKFQSIVMNDAISQKDKKLLELDKKKIQYLEEKELIFLQEAYNLIQAEKRKANKLSSDAISKSIMESKRALFSQRDRIVAEVFDRIYQSIINFVNSSAYNEYLLTTIASCVEMAGEGKKVVLLNGNDMRFVDNIKGKFAGLNLEIKAHEKNIIGGCLVLNLDRNISIDESLIERFNEQKQLFVEYSGLTLE